MTSIGSDEETLFICEGVLMYLVPEEIEKLFSFIRTHSSPRSRFAFTFMESENGLIRFRNASAAVGRWLRLRDEVFKWGIARDHLPEYLASIGFAVDRIAAHDSLRTRYLKSAHLDHLPLAEGECICVARIARC